jgi:drug/metabolite transporter (DMT)-like permease
MFVFSVRHGLPILLVVAGIVMIVLGHGHVSDTQTATPGSPFSTIPTDKDSFFSAIGVGALIIAVMVWMIGWFMRMNVTDGEDRRREEAARDYFARTGRWPGERGPRGTDT